MAVPGGDYTAIQASDGTWTILDVPFMAVGEVATYNAAGERVGSFDFDEAWIEKCIGVAQVKRREKFLARVFIDHHESGSSQEGAGYLMPTRVGELTIDGKDVVTGFGDLLHVPPHIYWRIKDGDLPYRSFEAFNPAAGFVSGLALMPTMPPRFDLPMLTIGTEIPWVEMDSGTVADATDEPMPVGGGLVACASRTQAVSAHRRGPRMPKPADTTILPEAAAFVPPPAAKAMDEDESKRKTEDEVDDVDEAAKGGDDETAPDGDKGEATTTDDDGTPATVQSVMRHIRGFQGTPEEVQALLAEMVAFLHEMGGDDTQEDGPPEQDRAAAHKEPHAMSKPNQEAIKAQARADLAMAEVEKLKAERELDKAVAKAAQELAEYPLGANPTAILQAKAETLGIDGFRIYVDAVKAHGTKSPGNADEDTADASIPDLPDDIAASGDPEVQARAMAAAREFDSRAAAGYPMGDAGARARFIRRKTQGRSTRLLGRN